MSNYFFGKVPVSTHRKTCIIEKYYSIHLEFSQLKSCPVHININNLDFWIFVFPPTASNDSSHKSGLEPFTVIRISQQLEPQLYRHCNYNYFFNKVSKVGSILRLVKRGQWFVSQIRTGIRISQQLEPQLYRCRNYNSLFQ